MLKRIWIIALVLLNISSIEDNLHNMKVHFNNTHLIESLSQNEIERTEIDFLINDILVIVKNYLYVTFFVKNDQMVSVDNSTDRYHLLIQIEAFNDSTGGFTSFTNFDYGELSIRPNKGIFKINLHYLKWMKNDRMKYYNYYYSIFQGFFHIMGYNNYGRRQLREKGLYSSEKKGFVIKSQKVLEYAKKHYNCNTLDYLLFEDKLRVNRWEDTQLGNDIMVFESKRNKKISDITLAYFEDLGWYKVNHNMGQILVFGLNKGCSFLKNPSTIYEEFSNSRKRTCSLDYRSTAFFNKTPYSNNFFVNSNYLNCSHYSQMDSSCIEYEVSGVYHDTCAQSRCLMEGDNLVVEFKYTTNIMICRNSNDHIQGNNFNLKCPDIKRFCEFRYECKNNCNGNGLCLNGTCICKNKFKGVACEFEVDKNSALPIDYYNLNKKCNFNGQFKDNKCECYDNYNGDKCERMILDIGSFGSKCNESNYVKCYTGEYYNYLNKDKTSNHNYLFNNIPTKPSSNNTPSTSNNTPSTNNNTPLTNNNNQSSNGDSSNSNTSPTSLIGNNNDDNGNNNQNLKKSKLKSEFIKAIQNMNNDEFYMIVKNFKKSFKSNSEFMDLLKEIN